MHHDFAAYFFSASFAGWYQVKLRNFGWELWHLDQSFGLNFALNFEGPFVAGIGLSSGSFERWDCLLFNCFCKNYCHPKSLG